LLLRWLFLLSHSFIFFWFHSLSLYTWLYVLYASVIFVNYVFLLLCLRIFIFMFMYSYCVCSFLCILFYFVVLCIVCVSLLPPDVNPITVSKYISYHLSYIIHHVSYHIMYHIMSNTLRFNPLQTKRRPLHLKTQSVPRCKHFSSRL